jgi:hypothetical protein
MVPELYDCVDKEARMVPVDGHVHFHTLERAAMTLDAAAANFQAQRENGAAGCLGMLLLNQAASEHVFEALRERASCASWTIRLAEQEPESLIAERENGWIVIVCGRQVRCERGLEVAALGTLHEYPDGQKVDTTLKRVRESGALACLPWGFGKWFGARGRVVERMLQENDPASLAVCDNGGRLQALGQPRLVREAARIGFKILPGTDPFPVGDDFRRAGAFGFLAPEPGRLHPWGDLLRWLQSEQSSPRAYGKALGPGRFIFNNIGIQLYNRRKRKAG